ncbi:MAG: hypothetical protein C0467_31735, partial [Planctomycetaceae bacterium]|nr:hypothetical protein [Planctomycetaceae bacterium]
MLSVTPTTLSLWASDSDIYSGQSVDLTAIVNGDGPLSTGIVTFMDGTKVLGTSTLSQSYDSATNSYVDRASLSVSNLSVGSQLITAIYSGDAYNAPSDSDPIVETVSRGTPTTTLTTSAANIFAGQSVTFTATMSSVGVTPTGIVTFMDGARVLGTGTLSQSYDYATYSYINRASLSVSNLSVGSRLITAIYSGDANNTSSNSDTIVETVSRGVASATLTTSAENIFAGQSVTFTATMSSTGATPTGIVTFMNGGQVLGTGTLSQSYDSATYSYINRAVLNVSNLSTGDHFISAVYNGDAKNTATATDPLTTTVSVGVPTLALTTSATTISAGESVQLTATVSGTGVTPTGVVTFLDGSTVLGSGVINQSYDSTTGSYVYRASISVSNLRVGTHSITAVYNGDRNNGSNVSNTVAARVIVGTTTTALTASSANLFAGQSLQLSASVNGTGSTPTGAVSFFDGDMFLGTGTLSNSYDSMTGTYANRASISVPNLSTGDHYITAVYSGDPLNETSASDPLATTVSLGATTATLTTSATTSNAGESVQLNVTVSGTGTTPTGAVTFLNGSTVLGSGIISQSFDYATWSYVNRASISVSNLGVGSHSITALYSGDRNNDTTTSAALTATVSGAGSSSSPTPVATTTTLTKSTESIFAGQSTSLTATVSGTGVTPTGVVTFFDGDTVLGVASLYQTGTSTYQANLSPPGLNAGDYAITAVYSGDTNSSTSSSDAV